MNIHHSNVLVSILTKAVNPDSGLGRGVNQGYKNIQRVRDTDPERTRHTLMHELGHAHGQMGDEYRSDERDLTDGGYNVVPTETESRAPRSDAGQSNEDITICFYWFFCIFSVRARTLLACE